MGGKLADAKVQDDEVQLFLHRKTGGPDVNCRFSPQLDRATRPPVLLLAVGKEASGQLREQRGVRVVGHIALRNKQFLLACTVVPLNVACQCFQLAKGGDQLVPLPYALQGMDLRRRASRFTLSLAKANIGPEDLPRLVQDAECFLYGIVGEQIGRVSYLIDTDDIVQVDGFPAIDIGSQREIHVLYSGPAFPPSYSYNGLPPPNPCNPKELSFPFVTNCPQGSCQQAAQLQELSSESCVNQRCNDLCTLYSLWGARILLRACPKYNSD